MGRRTFRLPVERNERSLSFGVGAALAVALFVLIALAQMMGRVEPPNNEVDEMLVAFDPPEIVEIEEEEPPPEEEEEPPPRLEEEPPDLSLEQLDIALNAGTGGSLAGDFAMPAIGTTQRELGTEDFVDFSDLDQVPRPVGVSGFNFPRRLRKQKVRGRVVILVRLSPEGKVIGVDLDSSTLPDFNNFILGEVKRWRFTPPTKNGNPVKAKARLPIPIQIQ